MDEQAIDLGIKFLRGYEPSPLPEPVTPASMTKASYVPGPVSSSAQTGDVNIALMMVILLAAFVVVGLLAYIVVKNKQFAKSTGTTNYTFAFANLKSLQQEVKIISAIFGIIAIFSMVVGVVSMNAHAADGEGPITATPNIVSAVVSEEGKITSWNPANVTLTNTSSTDKFDFTSCKVALTDEAKNVDALKTATIKITGFGGKEVFSGKASEETKACTGLSLDKSASTTLAFEITGTFDLDQLESLYDKQVFTISLTQKEVINWIPMQAEIHDETKIDFYPAFSDASQITGYEFATYDGTNYNKIQGINSMSDIYSALQNLSSGTPTTTLYYQKTSSAAQELKCYTVKDLTWDYVFGATITTGEATKYSQGFIEDYQQDKSGNPNGIKTALLAIDDFGSDWNISTYGSDEIPKLANNVSYNNTGFYECYGGCGGGLLSSASSCPWGCCADNSGSAFCFYVDYGEWDIGGRDRGDGVVLARAFN